MVDGDDVRELMLEELILGVLFAAVLVRQLVLNLRNLRICRKLTTHTWRRGVFKLESEVACICAVTARVLQVI